MNQPKINKKNKKALTNEAKAKKEKVRNNVILSLIVIYTFFLFFKAIGDQFVNWDDNSYILDNVLIRDFSFKGFAKIFSTPVIGMYNPLPFVVYTFLYKFWALDSKAYNLTNILFHLVAVVAMFKFIYYLTKRYETSTIVALLFAVHPMHAEVVTWVSETKTSMFAAFYLLALINYIWYVRSEYQIKYLIYTGLLFLASVLSKPTAVTLPVMLLLVDYYLTRKIDKRLILEKIPFFIISLFFGVLTLATHLSVGDSIFESNQGYSLINNLLVSNYSIVFYINKIFLPLDLCLIYPYPDNALLLPWYYYLSIPVIPLLFLLIYKAGTFRKEVIFGVLFFIIAISVELRIIPSGFFRASDVYTYLSYTGFFFIAGQFFTYVSDHKLHYWQKVKNYVVVLFIGLFLFYSWRATVSISVWQNSITLFDDVIAKNPKFALAYSNRGISKLQGGDVQGAMDDFTEAIIQDPKYALAYNNRGKVLVDRKDYDHAMQDLNTAIALDPKYDEAYINRGNIYFNRGQYDQAMSNYNAALSFDSSVAITYKNRGAVKMILKDTIGALKDLTKSVTLNPEYVDGYMDRGNIEYSLDKFDDALRDYNKAIHYDPSNPTAYNNRSIIRKALKDTAGADQDAEKAAALKQRWDK